MSRAVVVGGGLAGSVTALELAARGIDTTVVARTPGATALTWGTLDVAGAAPGPGGLPARHPLRGDPIAPEARLRVWCREHAHHPYARIFRGEQGAAAAPGELKAAVAALDAWLAPAGLRVGGGLDATRWIPDVRGALRGADFAFGGCAEAALEDAAEIVVVDLPGLAGFDARPAARALAAEIDALGLGPRAVRVATLGVDEALLPPGGSPDRLAARLDDPAALETLRGAVAPLRAAPGALVLLPPVLGIERSARVIGALREATGARVGELVAAPPLAVPGLRLAHALRAALARAGIAVRHGRAERVVHEGGRVRGVDVAAPIPTAARPGSERLPADAVVLATGRFVGGGVVHGRSGLAEPVLGLPLWETTGARVDGVPPHRLVDPDYGEPQALFTAGVRTDASLRPLDARGAPACAGVFAAGELLYGFDPARQRTGLGVALATGRHAGARAARWLSEGGS